MLLHFINNSWLALLLTVICSYLLGSISFAIIVTKLFSKKDIRDFGSGNAGATNVLRSQGKLPALLTTIGDLTKGIVSVYLGGYLLTNLQLLSHTEVCASFPLCDPENLALMGNYLAGFFCIIGHMYPIFFRFRGGKGVMTTAGMLLFLDWRATVTLLAVFILVVLITRMVSLGSIVVAAALPIVTYCYRAFWYQQGPVTVGFCTLCMAIIGLIVILKHRENLKRIISGTENKI